MCWICFLPKFLIVITSPVTQFTVLGLNYLCAILPSSTLLPILLFQNTIWTWSVFHHAHSQLSNAIYFTPSTGQSAHVSHSYKLKHFEKVVHLCHLSHCKVLLCFTTKKFYTDAFPYHTELLRSTVLIDKNGHIPKCKNRLRTTNKT